MDRTRISSVLTQVLPQWRHGCVPARLLDITARHASCDVGHVIYIKVSTIQFCVAEDELEKATSLHRTGQRNRKSLGHTTQYGLINVVDSVGCAQDHDSLRMAS